MPPGVKPRDLYWPYPFKVGFAAVPVRILHNFLDYQGYMFCTVRLLCNAIAIHDSCVMQCINIKAVFGCSAACHRQQDWSTIQ
jgi:hypothetical protein